MKTSFREFLKTAKVVFVVLVVTIATQYASAVWAPPSAAPPLGNTPAPVNIGSIEQMRFGLLRMQSGITLGEGFTPVQIANGAVGLAVIGGRVGIGTAGPTVPLDVNGALKSTSATAFEFCMGGVPGTNCINAWPTGGPGGTTGVTSIKAGTNISVSGTGTPADGGQTGQVTIVNTATGGTGGSVCSWRLSNPKDGTHQYPWISRATVETQKPTGICRCGIGTESNISTILNADFDGSQGRGGSLDGAPNIEWICDNDNTASCSGGGTYFVYLACG